MITCADRGSGARRTEGLEAVQLRYCGCGQTADRITRAAHTLYTRTVSRTRYSGIESPGRSSSQAIALIFHPLGVFTNCVVIMPRASNDCPPDVPDFA